MHKLKHMKRAGRMLQDKRDGKKLEKITDEEENKQRSINISIIVVLNKNTQNRNDNQEYYRKNLS